MNFNIPFGQLLGDKIGGADFFVGQFGVGVDVSPDGLQGRRMGENFRKDAGVFHAGVSINWWMATLGSMSAV